MTNKDDIIAKALQAEEGKKALGEVVLPIISWYKWEIEAPKIRNKIDKYYVPDYPILYTEEDDQEFTKKWSNL